jgi:hypothetical protein
MDVSLFLWAFFVSSVFANIWCQDSGRVEFPALTLLSRPPAPHPALSLSLNSQSLPLGSELLDRDLWS